MEIVHSTDKGDTLSVIRDEGTRKRRICKFLTWSVVCFGVLLICGLTVAVWRLSEFNRLNFVNSPVAIKLVAERAVVNKSSMNYLDVEWRIINESAIPIVYIDEYVLYECIDGDWSIASWTKMEHNNAFLSKSLSRNCIF